jgi:hypothetical protein
MGVSEGGVQGDGIAIDGLDGAHLGLPGVVIGGGQHNPVARAPAAGIQHGDLGGADGGGLGQFGPAFARLAVQIQDAPHHPQHLGAHAHLVFVGVVAGEGDDGAVAEGLVGGADLELPVHHNPVCAEFQVSVIEAQNAVDGQALEGGWAYVEHHSQVSGNHHHLAGAG